MTVELASALHQKVAGGALSAVDASAALAATLDAIADGVIELADDEALVQSALNLALSMAHKVPDCLYLAPAEREGASIVSADRKLIALARRRGVEVVQVPAAV